MERGSRPFNQLLTLVYTSQLNLQRIHQNNMAITHNDLSPRSRNPWLTSKHGLLLIVLCVLCGFTSFVLCLAAEATRSEATWLLMTKAQAAKTYRCYYLGSGRTPLTCAIVAFFTLAVALLLEHAFILMTISSPKPPALISWTMMDVSDSPSSPSAFTCQACFLFVTTWVTFAVAEVLLMVGIDIEMGHLRDWKRLRPKCVVVRQGLFATAGVFGLTTVLLAAGLYLTALRAQKLLKSEQDTERRDVPNTSIPNQQQNLSHEDTSLNKTSSSV